MEEQKLSDMAIKSFFRCLIQRPVEEMENVRMRNTVEIMDYFEKHIAEFYTTQYHSPALERLVKLVKLNVSFRMLRKLHDEEFWDKSVREPGAWDVALFVHEEETRLQLYNMSPNFDLEFLLRVCGHKLKNLTMLQLPKGCTLTAKACKRMCQTLPNLSMLDISDTVIEDDAATYIARLPLVWLDAYGTNEDFVRNLCTEESTLTKTLRKFGLSDELSIACYCLVLNTMKFIEFLDSFESMWLKGLLPIGVPPPQYNLKMLQLVYPHDAIEEELEIALLTCPKIYKILIAPNIFTLQMLQSLTKFQQLRTLYLDLCYDSDVKMEEGNDSFDRVCLRDLRFENLVQLFLYNDNVHWVTSDYLLQLLDMCPKLEELSFLACPGFSNKTARELAAVMTEKLKRLEFRDCDLLGPSGIKDLLKIDSLVELKVNLGVNEIRRQHFDVRALQVMAVKHGVDLELRLQHSFDENHEMMEMEVEFLEPRIDMMEAMMEAMVKTNEWSEAPCLH